MKISEVAKGRNNNFNLIRIIAAYTVLVTHSFALAGKEEPFVDIFGMSIGTIAVDVFFITSGFLVTGSLVKRKSVLEFVWARVLRIFPALFPMLLLTVLVIGLYFTTLSSSSYLTDPLTYKYFLKNLIMIRGYARELPGVFASNPGSNSVNGSLWTLPYEIRMYEILAVLWLFLLVVPRFQLKVFKVAIVAGALLAGTGVILAHVNILTIIKAMGYFTFLRLFFMFFCGSAYFVLKDRIVLSGPIFFIFATALVLSCLNPRIFFVVYALTLAYIIMYLAYVPSGFIRRYNELGDYSYGMYIYAFPIQQSVAALIPGVPVLSMWFISTTVTFILAVLSWHFVEKRALRFKERYANYINSLPSLGLTWIKQRKRAERPESVEVPQIDGP